MDNEALNGRAHTVWACPASPGCLPRSETSGVYAKPVFNFLRNCQAVFSKGPFYIPTRSVFLHMLSHVVLIGVSLMAADWPFV